MLHLGKTKPALQVIYDQIGTPTYARDLAHAILALLDKGQWSPGIFHFSNEGVASWYDFAMAIFKQKGLTLDVVPVRTQAFPTPARRPAYSVLDKAKFKSTFDQSIRHWQEALSECLTLLP